MKSLLFFRGDWTLEEDLQILEEVEKHGTKWALISRGLNCRNENSVKNRYFSLMGLHSLSRKKKKVSIKSINEKIAFKIMEIKEKLGLEKKEQIKIEPEFMPPPTLTKTLKKPKNVYFSQDLVDDIKEDLVLPLISTQTSKKKICPIESAFEMGNSSIYRINNNGHLFQEIERTPFMLQKQFSECNLDPYLKRPEESLTYSNGILKDSFETNFNRNMYFQGKNMSQNPKSIKESNINVSQRFLEEEDMFNKKKSLMDYENMSSSSISLKEIHHPMLNSKSFIEKEKSNITESSNSYKEKQLLISAILNLKSEGSKISSLESALSKDWKLVRDKLEYED